MSFKLTYPKVSALCLGTLAQNNEKIQLRIPLELESSSINDFYFSWSNDCALNNPIGYRIAYLND